MTQRKYSIDEIDRMRRALQTYHDFYDYDHAWVEKKKPAEIEDELRTHMLNGTDPGELVAEGEKRRAEFWKKSDEEDEERERQEAERQKALEELAQNSQKDLQKLQQDLIVETQTLHPWDSIKRHLPKIYGGSK